jgi:bifunctional DNA-binding transcriptional regulator/antitoxin component of YhaV-PrlF toxin-antitoxin module
MVEIIFKDNKIQTGYRIKIPKAIIDTLNLKIREKILIKFDAENRKIVIEEDKNSKKESKK